MNPVNRAALRRALLKIIWAYVLIHLHFNLGSINLLPDWAGYILLWQAIGLLEGDLRDLALLRPFCMGLGWWAGAEWGCALFGITLDGRFFLLDLLIWVITLYFHFQLFTDLALLAERLAAEEGPEAPARPGRGLRLCRNWTAILSTLTFFLGLWEPDASSGPVQLLTVLLIAAQFAVMIAKLAQLSGLRRRCPPEEEAPGP